MSDRLGEILVREGDISKEQLDKAVQRHREVGMRLGSCLIDMGLIGPDRIAEIVARQLDAKPIAATDIRVDSQAVAAVPSEVALDYELMPMRIVGDTLEVVIGEPNNYFGIDDLKLRTGFENVKVFVAPQIMIRQLIARYYRKVRGRRHIPANASLARQS